MRRCIRDARAPRRSAAAAVHRTRAGCATTKRVTRRCMRVRPARSPRRRPGFTSMRACSIRSARAACAIAYVTLHVGAGTFQPVRSERRRASTKCTASGIRCRRRRRRDPRRRRERAGGRVLASARRRCVRSRPPARRRICARACGETRLFIVPGLSLQRRRPAAHELPPAEVDAAHARVGVRRLSRTSAARTRTPSRQRYRFYSYGDAMLIERAAEQ